jgi:hypothetical protein
MRDRTRRRNYSPEAEEFRRVHKRHRDWGLIQRHAQKLRRLHASADAIPTPAATSARPQTREPVQAREPVTACGLAPVDGPVPVPVCQPTPIDEPVAPFRASEPPTARESVLLSSESRSDCGVAATAPCETDPAHGSSPEAGRRVCRARPGRCCCSGGRVGRGSPSRGSNLPGSQTAGSRPRPRRGREAASCSVRGVGRSTPASRRRSGRVAPSSSRASDTSTLGIHDERAYPPTGIGGAGNRRGRESVGREFGRMAELRLTMRRLG